MCTNNIKAICKQILKFADNLISIRANCFAHSIGDITICAIKKFVILSICGFPHISVSFASMGLIFCRSVSWPIWMAQFCSVHWGCKKIVVLTVYNDTEYDMTLQLPLKKHSYSFRNEYENPNPTPHHSLTKLIT